ncbi:hypothetical protein E3N88_34421 [Mikania micrantha]|uniref:Uncharacterized protein n=1 Tax=Mikania micrantha TaxID=192012 RepID=A0A5N6LYC7_9ASTR|nr:hypothetical protein E3N88_34421 [Mikania micrantha]
MNTMRGVSHCKIDESERHKCETLVRYANTQTSLVVRLRNLSDDLVLDPLMIGFLSEDDEFWGKKGEVGLVQYA